MFALAVPMGNTECMTTARETDETTRLRAELEILLRTKEAEIRDLSKVELEPAA
jgi:hypothetical protein